jgi:hypothetical protein
MEGRRVPQTAIAERTTAWPAANPSCAAFGTTADLARVARNPLAAPISAPCPRDTGYGRRSRGPLRADATSSPHSGWARVNPGPGSCHAPLRARIRGGRR